MRKLALTLTTVLYLTSPAGACGWYLMSPPAFDGATYTTSPYIYWEKYGSFDTADECNLALLRVQVINSDYTHYLVRKYINKQLGSSIVSFKTWKKLIQQSQCISVDDPNLKGR